MLQACVSIRKQGKKLAIYDLTIEIKWIGQVDGGEEEVDGTIKIGEFASESDEDDWLIECTTIKSGSDAVSVQNLFVSYALYFSPVKVWHLCRTDAKLWQQIS